MTRFGAGDRSRHRGGAGRHPPRHQAQYRVYRAAERHLARVSGAPGASGACHRPPRSGLERWDVAGRLCVSRLLAASAPPVGSTSRSALAVAGAHPSDGRGPDASALDHDRAAARPRATAGLGGAQTAGTSSQARISTGYGRGRVTTVKWGATAPPHQPDIPELCTLWLCMFRCTAMRGMAIGLRSHRRREMAQRRLAFHHGHVRRPKEIVDSSRHTRFVGPMSLDVLPIAGEDQHNVVRQWLETDAAPQFHPCA
jgi:hypothetical protein